MSAAGRSLRARIRQVNSEQADDLRMVQTASDDLKHRSFSTACMKRKPTSSASVLTVSICPSRPEAGTLHRRHSNSRPFAANAGGWNSDNAYPRQLADISGNGSADIVGFAATGVWTAPSLT